MISLQPYVAWDVRTAFRDPKLVSTTERIEGLHRIVEVEGPILAHRAYTLYVKSAGLSRVGKEVRHDLNSAMSAALRKGVLVADNPLGEVGNQPLTLRLPEQGLLIVREIGPRSFHEVPPAELAAVIRMVRSKSPFHDDEQVCRRVLELYGLKRLTQGTWDRFRVCAGMKLPEGDS